MPTIRVESVVVNATTSTVEVNISLINNPGITSLQFNVNYDSGLVLKKVAFDPAFGAYVTAPEPYTNPQCVTFISPLVEVNASGKFATLTFEISDSVNKGDKLDISVVAVPENIYDEDFNEVIFGVINGAVTVS